MKKILLSCILFVSCISVNAQTATSINENFDASCLFSTGHVSGWIVYNPILGSASPGNWECAPIEGRGGTPGMTCTDTFGTPNAYHLDTSYLITPLLDVSSYAPDSVWLRFDSKTIDFSLGGKLNIAESADTGSLFTGSYYDVTDSAFPVIGEGDSSGWVTHQINLWQFESLSSFCLAFRFGSPATSGNTWYLDNIRTSTESIVRVAEVNTPALSLKVIGYPSSSQITLSYTTVVAGVYNLEVYDVMGGIAYKEVLNTRQGTSTYNIDNLNLKPGLYLIKMGNGICYRTAKAVVR